MCCARFSYEMVVVLLLVFTSDVGCYILFGMENS